MYNNNDQAEGLDNPAFDTPDFQEYVAEMCAQHWQRGDGIQAQAVPNHGINPSLPIFNDVPLDMLGYDFDQASSIPVQDAAQYGVAETHPVTRAASHQGVDSQCQVINISDTEDQLGSPEDGEDNNVQESKRLRRDEHTEPVIDDISNNEPAIAASRSRWSTEEHTRIINVCWGKGSDLYNLILSSNYKVAAKKIVSLGILPGRQEAAIKDKIIKIQALYPALKAYFAVTGGGGDADDDPAVIDNRLKKMARDPMSSEYTANLNLTLLKLWVKNRAWFDVIDERMRGKPNVNKSRDYRSGNLSPAPLRKRKSDHLTADDGESGANQDSDATPGIATLPTSKGHQSAVPEKPFGGKPAKKEPNTTTDALIAVSNFMTAKVESQRRSDLHRDKRLRLEQVEKRFVAAKDLLSNENISEELRQKAEDVVTKYVTGESAREIEEELTSPPSAPSHQLPSPLSSDEGEVSPQDSAPAPTAPTPATPIPSFVAHLPAGVTSFPIPSHQLPSSPSSDEGELSSPSTPEAFTPPLLPAPATSILSFVTHPPASVASFPIPSHQLPSPPSSDEGKPSLQDFVPAPTAPTPATSIPSFVTHPPASVASFHTPSHQLPSPPFSDKGGLSPQDSAPAPTAPTPAMSSYSFVAHTPASVTSFLTASHQLLSPPSSDEGEPSHKDSAPAPTAPTLATSIPSFVTHPLSSVTSFSTPSHQLLSPPSSDKGSCHRPTCPLPPPHFPANAAGRRIGICRQDRWQRPLCHNGLDDDGFN
ncbi:hypothetical protein K488DRAFT_91800 [Vararia minispora EC-137]|uniref:Uncharacterized protein n=1 Tax=Vararia minispora EC-137 TaxID=1314806 RepID=A0ACB8Q593_9AGAM|nr:hypothetical protein K488DRAFT_91800 [Vararia minispora EC-137]